MPSGLIVRGVTLAERLQRLAEDDGDFDTDNRAVDFPSRWAIYTFVRSPRFETGPRHETATRQDHAVKDRQHSPVFPACFAV